MEIHFKSRKLNKQITNSKKRKKAYGDTLSSTILKRIDDLSAASTLKDMEYLPGKCHELKGDRKGQFALNLNSNLRLVFEPDHDPVLEKENGGIDWEQVVSILILEIIDYH